MALMNRPVVYYITTFEPWCHTEWVTAGSGEQVMRYLSEHWRLLGYKGRRAVGVAA